MAIGEWGASLSPKSASTMVIARISTATRGAPPTSLAREAEARIPLGELESDARVEEGIADVSQQVDDDDQGRPEQHRELQDREVAPGDGFEGQPPQARPGEHH